MVGAVLLLGAVIATAAAVMSLVMWVALMVTDFFTDPPLPVVSRPPRESQEISGSSTTGPV